MRTKLEKGNVKRKNLDFLSENYAFKLKGKANK